MSEPEPIITECWLLIQFDGTNSPTFKGPFTSRTEAIKKLHNTECPDYWGIIGPLPVSFELVTGE